MKIINKIFLSVTALFVFFSYNVRAEKTQMSVARAYYELARQNNTQKIEALLHKGYPLNSVDSRGYNAVCISIVNQDKKAYKTLISYGASKNPPCIKKIPDNVYHRFFGIYPNKTVVKPYTPDEPYLISTAVLGAGAITGAALLISASSGGGSSSGEGDNSGNGGNNEEDEKPVTPDCPANSSYNQKTKKCECNVGYGNYGDKSKCYASISHCTEQVKDICKSCDAGYKHKDNKCYAPIPNCQIQDGGICQTCYSGYGVHGGDGSTCYKNIENCDIQNKDKCESCISGYGVHGGDGRICYKNIEHCAVQIQTICKQCGPGYSTYGDPAANKCYVENPCKGLDNTVPINYGEQCVCDENRGYTGEPGSCARVEDGQYQEGDGSKEEWNDLNAQYCNSHGKYLEDNKVCLCYTGYANADDSTTGCSVCDTANGYKEINGLCFYDLKCKETRGEGFEQSGNSCVCADGYYSVYNENGQQCMPNIKCDLHHEQYWDGSNAKLACKCKDNFDEACDKCVEGFELDEVNDICVRTSYVCNNENGEKWTGEKCDICPSQYKITEDENGVHCGLQCADNRADISSNHECTACNEGYRDSSIYNNCIKDSCSIGEEGYVVINNACVCDEEKGFFFSASGLCEKKEADLIGNSTTNINNSKIELNNDGVLRDVYGMKPVIINEDGEETFFDNVYNAYAVGGDTQVGEINITNNNSGNNNIYGIYSQSKIYNASATNNKEDKVEATGIINIKDTASVSDIYGIKNIGKDDTYNAFVYANSEKSQSEPSENSAKGTIAIEKPQVEGIDASSGDIIGIDASGNIFNSYANSNGIGTNVEAIGEIKIKHEGKDGEVIGIKGNNAEARINNAYSFLNSAVSDVSATGEIILSGNRNVYGVHSQGTVVNAESQFNKAFNKIGEFKSDGLIDVTTNSSINAAYGIFIESNSGNKTEVYNAMGYNAKGSILSTNIKGGSAYGIYSNAQTYIGVDTEDGKNEKAYYNNVYNAFRSSARYGGDNTSTLGEIKIGISGNSASNSEGVGIYSAGNAFNAFANSGSDVKLETQGTINITDNTLNSGIKLKGIEAKGNLIANAYSKGTNLNTDTVVTGDIAINVDSNKNGVGGYAAGIYTSGGQVQEANIYNAALINDKNSVTGKITISSKGAPLSYIYGIYAAGGKDGDQPKTVYNAYYDNDEKISAGSVLGEINVTNKYGSASYGEYYGIYVKGGSGQYSAYNAYTSNSNADVQGVINVNVAGGANNNSISAIAVGMYGDNANINNSGNSTINVKTTNNNSYAYGMKGDNVNIYNDAEINVDVGKSSAYGLYANKGTIINDKNGVINVKGEKDNYGIYAVSGKTNGETVTVNNLGTINLSGKGNNTGIYATGPYATVQNSGNIIINSEKVNNIEDNNQCKGEDCPKNVAIKLENGATLKNDGVIQSNDAIDLASIGGNVVLDKNGKFISEKEISGNLQISQNIVTGNFDKETLIEGVILSENVNNLNVSSNSYMYDSKIKENNKGEYDIVMEMKDFSTFDDKAEYYTLNYNKENNVELYNALKSAPNYSEAKQIDADITGTAVLPNITQENLKVMRSLDSKMISDLFKDDKQDVRKIVGADTMFIGRDDHGTLTGYDIDAQSMYALYDKKLDNQYRLGLGLSFTHSNTDYNNDSSRKNFMVQGYIPLTYTNNKGLTAVSMAKLGYSDGDYTRMGHNESFDANTNEITYGLLNELRYSVNLGGIIFTPFAGLNATGWYQNSINEGNSNLAINIDSANIFSLESALGIYIDKDIEFNNSKLSVLFGAGYYHEFADPYKGLDAKINNTIGHYKLRDIEHLHSRDRGMISAKVNYDYKDFSIYGELMQYLEKEYPIKLDVGLKYKF